MTTDETPQQPKLINRWPYSDEDNVRILEIAKDYTHEKAKKLVRKTLRWKVSAHHIGDLRRKTLDGNTSVARDGPNHTATESDGRKSREKLQRGHLLDVTPEVPGYGLERKVSALRAAGDREKPKGVEKPEMVVSPTKQYKRDPKVIEWVEFRAEGRCELCDAKAPFARLDGTPFLEVHHVIPLSEDGSDTPENAVALCPNCHRLCHHGADRMKVTAKLQRELRKLYP